jgi:hypothetical protein
MILIKNEIKIMLAESKNIKIILKEIEGDCYQKDKMSPLISFLEHLIDLSVRVVSEKARNDFIVKTYQILGNTVEVNIRANEENILHFLEEKQFNFHQYDNSCTFMESFLLKIKGIFIKNKNKKSHKKDEIENKKLIVRTLSNLFIEQLESIFNTNIKITHERFYERI